MAGSQPMELLQIGQVAGQVRARLQGFFTQALKNIIYPGTESSTNRARYHFRPAGDLKHRKNCWKPKKLNLTRTVESILKNSSGSPTTFSDGKIKTPVLIVRYLEISHILRKSRAGPGLPRPALLAHYF